MNLSQWKNFGYPGQDLAPFEPILAGDNLATLTNYGRLCGCLFISTAVLHYLFGFFPLRGGPCRCCWPPGPLSCCAGWPCIA